MPPQVHGTGSGSAPVVQQAPAGVEEVRSSDLEKKTTEQQKDAPKTDDAKPYRATSKEASNRKAELSTQATAQRAALNEKLEEKSGKAKPTDTTAKSAQRKPSGKQSEGGAWAFVKDAAKFATNAAGAGVATLRDATANASVTHLAEKANAHVTDGMKKAQEVTLQHREVTLQKKSEQLAAELKQVASGKPSFEEADRMIQKIDAFKRDIDEAGGSDVHLHRLYYQDTVKPTRMETREFGDFKVQVKSQHQDEPVNHMQKLLGVYGYDKHIPAGRTGIIEPGQERITQSDILDTALHNWRATPEQERRMLHGLASPPINLPKQWKTPIEVREWNQKVRDKQVTLQNEPEGNRMAPPIARERENQTDPDVALARGKKEVVDGAAHTIGSMGGFQAKGGKSTSVSEPIGKAKAPHRGTPPEKVSHMEVEPGYRSTPLRKSEQKPVAQPDPATQAKQRAEMELNRQISVRTPNGTEKISVGEYRNRVQQAQEWVQNMRDKNGETNERGQTYINRATPGQRRRAAEMFGLDENWDRIGNPNMGRMNYDIAPNQNDAWLRQNRK